MYNRPFQSCPKPLFQSEAKCKDVFCSHIKLIFTQPRFETEGFWNSEMAYFAVETYGSSYNQRRKLPYVGTISRQAVVAAMSRGGLKESYFTSEGWIGAFTIPK